MMKTMGTEGSSLRRAVARRAAARPWMGPVRALAFAGLLALMACGGSEATSDQAASGEVTHEALQRQVERMEEQAAKAEAELQALRVQIAETQALLQTEGGVSEAPTAVAPVDPEKPAQASDDAAPAEKKAAGGLAGPAIRLILLIAIVAAIYSIARIFFGRWSEPPVGEPAYATAGADVDLSRTHASEGDEASPSETAQTGDAPQNDSDPQG